MEILQNMEHIEREILKNHPTRPKISKERRGVIKANRKQKEFLDRLEMRLKKKRKSDKE